MIIEGSGFGSRALSGSGPIALSTGYGTGFGRLKNIDPEH
jgi:hypothetical protein